MSYSEVLMKRVNTFCKVDCQLQPEAHGRCPTSRNPEPQATDEHDRIFQVTSSWRFHHDSEIKITACSSFDVVDGRFTGKAQVHGGVRGSRLEPPV
jgi:hypothetical protein